MTASTFSATDTVARGATQNRRLPGLHPLFRKDVSEWMHGYRVPVILFVVTAFMTLSAANAWINAWLVANVPSDTVITNARFSMAPLDNLVAAVSSQIFVVAAIFAAMSLLVGERESGTLAWVASKPVARASIWISKWAAGAAVLALVAGIVPIGITTILVTVLYGAPAILPVVALSIGAVAAIVLFVAVVLAASAAVSSQPAVAAIGFAAMLGPTVLAAVVPFSIEPWLPTSILGWSVGLAMGADVGVVTPIAWAISVIALVTFASSRMDALEL
jgi:ABC-2 type transport system permease protein